MGMIILFMAVFVEAVFVAFCIIAKSNYAREKSLIWIASFLCFVMLVYLSTIDWSFRYYALASLLLLLAIFGAINIIYKKKEKKEYKARCIILKAIGMTVLIFMVTLPAIVFPQNKAILATTGEHQVLTHTSTYTDQKRIESYTNTDEKRKLNVQWWYPDNSDVKYPLVVFSHGGLGVKSSNETLYNELASHGYVVCSIDHTYQSFYTTDEDGDTTWIDLDYMKELFAENPQSDLQQSYVYYQKWMKIRLDDINFVIDTIFEEIENNHLNKVYKIVDMERIGVMGHSLGGSAALGVGRIRNDVNAIVALESPFMYDIEGIDDNQFVFTEKIYPVPVLNVYSDSSWSILGDRPQYAANYALLTTATSSTAFNVYISGVGHLALTDFALSSPLLTRIIDRQEATTEKTLHALKTINKVCLDFFNSYLKEKGEFDSGGSY